MRSTLVALLAGALTLTGCKGCERKPPEAPPPPQVEKHAEADPPPAKAGPAQAAGVSLAVAEPEHDPDFGRGLSVVADGQGTVALAWLQRDMQRAADDKATVVMFTVWDPAKKAFRAPVRVSPRNLPIDTRNHTLGLARDAQTGAYAIAFDTAEKDADRIGLAVSKDGGATWTAGLLPAMPDAETSTQPAIAAANGQLHVIWVSKKLMYTHAPVDTAAASWPAATALATPPGEEGIHAKANPSIACDAHGKPAMTYGTGVAALSGVTFYFVRPGDATPTQLLNTGAQNDDFDARLAFQGDNPRVAIAAGMTDKDVDPDAWSLKSDDGGKTWSKPVPIPRDGNHWNNRMLSFAVSPGGKAAMTTGIGSGNNDASKCKDPQLSRSSDLASWSTCSPLPNLEHYFNSDFPQVTFDGEKLVMAFVSNNESLMPKGIAVWHE